jgi:hypothetical protein
MANTATAQTALPIKIGKGGASGYVVPYVVVIDTVDTDLTIRDPAADNYAAIVGIQYLEATAHNVTFKSGSTTLVALEKPASSGMSERIGAPIIVAAKGDALVIRSSAAISSMLVYVAEFNEYIL